LTVRRISLGLMVVACALAWPAVAAATDYAPVIAQLQRDIPRELATAHTEGLTIALVDGDETVWTQGFGTANAATGAPVTADTLFHIGSSSKSIAASAVMQLVEEGKLDLDAPLVRYLPGYTLLPRYANNDITLRSVLDLHSGIPGDVNNGFITTEPDERWLGWLMGTLATQFPERPVNTGWAYSNSSYALLQLVVEHVTGQPFDVWSREHLLDPMGMTRASFNDTELPDDDWARPYEVVGDKAVPRPREYVNGWTAGSVMASANDMAAYLRTMISRGVSPTGAQVLKASTVRQMITPQTAMPMDVMPFRQGLGWWLGDAPKYAWMGPVAHWNGDTVNYATFMRWLPESGLGVFVSVNTKSPVPVRDDIGFEALGLMVTAKTGRVAPPDAGAAPASRVVKVAPRVLRAAAGRYAELTGLDLVRVSGNGLLWTQGAQNAGEQPTLMLPRADGWYTPTGRNAPDVSIRFETVGVRRLLLVRENGVWPNAGVAAAAERIPEGYRVGPAWRARMGQYEATNILANTYPGFSARHARLMVSHGVLIFQMRVPGVWISRVLRPAGPRRAWTFGMVAYEGQRLAGNAMIPTGNQISLLGQAFRKIH
jgi:CubicO group peptidase (beta-lactamase class C family)